MTRIAKLLALVSVSLTIFAAASQPAEAQVRRFRIHERGFYRPPGSNVLIYPAPRYGYQVGGIWIFPGRSSYQPSYTWPYGYPPGYRWPYGNSVSGWGRHRRWR